MLYLLTVSITGVSGILLFVIANQPEDKEARRIMILVAKVVQEPGLDIMKIKIFTYLSEVVPVSLKGAVFSLVPILTLLRQLLAAVVGFAVAVNGTAMTYMIALGSQWMVAFPPFIFVQMISRRLWEKYRKNNPQAALKSLQRLLGPKIDARAVLAKLEYTIEEEAKTSAKARYIDTFKSTNIRRTLTIMFAGTVESLWGLPLLLMVSLYLKVLGMPASKALLFLISGIIVGLFANVGSAWTLSHIGRRKLTYSTFLITSALWTIMGFAGIKQSNITPYISGGISTAVISVCGLGIWPVSYAIQGETSILCLRAKFQVIGTVLDQK